MPQLDSILWGAAWWNIGFFATMIVIYLQVVREENRPITYGHVIISCFAGFIGPVMLIFSGIFFVIAISNGEFPSLNWFNKPFRRGDGE